MKKQLLKNTSSLIVFNIAKMIFPFLTLPYLTRILTIESYGIVAYVKSVMTYMQIAVDFGFILSATKDVVKARHNDKYLAQVIGDTMIAKVILGVVCGLVLAILCFVLPILRENILFTLLSYIVVFQSIFLMDFLFRGLEIMHIITIRFIVMKSFALVLTFLFVRSDSSLLLIPIFDILGSSIAIVLVVAELKKKKIYLQFTGIKKSLNMIRESFVFFISSVASTSFNAFSTLLIGVLINSTEVAYWSVCMQIVGSIQACYTPISDGIYPEMIRTKNINLIKNILKVLTPIALLGSVVCFICADIGMFIIGGEKYLRAASIFRILVPCLFFGFLAIMLGWPALGVIGKVKETTCTTVFCVIIHIVCLVILIVVNKFNLVNIAIVRSFTDVLLFALRFVLVLKNRKLFNEK